MENQQQSNFNLLDIDSAVPENERSMVSSRNGPRKQRGGNPSRQLMSPKGGDDLASQQQQYRPSSQLASGQMDFEHQRRGAQDVRESQHSGRDTRDRREENGQRDGSDHLANDDQVKNMSRDLEETNKILDIVGKFEEEYFQSKQKYNGLDKITMNSDINMKTMCHCYKLIKQNMHKENPNFDQEKMESSLDAVLKKVKAINENYSTIKGEYMAVQDQILNKDTFSLKLDRVKIAKQKQEQIFVKIDDIDDYIYENEEQVNLMKTKYEDFEQAVFEMKYGQIQAVMKETNSKFDGIQALITKVENYCKNISESIANVKPQHVEQGQKLDQVKLEVFNVNALLETQVALLGKELKCRKALSEDFEKCSQIVDDIIKYSPWQDSEKLNLVELVAQTRTLEILVKNCNEWTALYKRLKLMKEQDVEVNFMNIQKTSSETQRFLDITKNQRRDEQDELLKRIQKQARLNTDSLQEQGLRLKRFEENTLDFEVSQHVADQDILYLSKEVNRCNSAILCQNALKESLLEDSIQIDNMRDDDGDHMIDPVDLDQLDQNLADLEKQQNIDIPKIVKNIDQLENFSTKALKNKLNDDNKKSQGQIAVMKKNYDDLQKIIEELNKKAGKVKEGIDGVRNELVSEDIEKDGDIAKLLDARLSECEKDINGDKNERTNRDSFPDIEMDDGGRSEMKMSLQQRKKQIVARINKMVNQFNENNKLIKEANKTQSNDRDMNELIMKNQEIQDECLVIEQKVSVAKEFGEDIDQRLTNLLNTAIKQLRDKYTKKNALIDDCDQIFDQNEALVNELEEQLNQQLEDVKAVLKGISQVSPLENPSLAQQDNRAFIQEVTDKNEVAQQLNAELEAAQDHLTKLKDKLMDQIQPLNELNERVVDTAEVEEIKDKMVDLARQIDAHEKQISPFDKQVEDIRLQTEKMLKNEKLKKMKEANEQMDALNEVISDLEKQNLEASSRLQDLKGLIAQTKSKEGVDDPELYNHLKKLEAQAKEAEKELKEIEERSADLKKNRNELKKAIENVEENPDNFTPFQIDALITNEDEERTKAFVLLQQSQAATRNLEATINDLEERIGASRQAKGLYDTIKDLNEEFQVNCKEIKDQLTTLPEQLHKALKILKEMKKGSEPDDSADYWEERKQIDKHMKDGEDAIAQLQEINQQFDAEQGSIAALQKDIKETPISEVAALEGIAGRLEKQKSKIDELLTTTYDVKDVFDTTRAEMGDCQIPVNISMRANECNQFSEKIDLITDEFNDLKNADEDFEGSGKSEKQIRQTIKQIADGLSTFEKTKRGFLKKIAKLEALKKKDIESLDNVNIIIDIRDFKGEIGKENTRLTALNDLVSDLNNQLILQDMENATKLLDVKNRKLRERLTNAKKELQKINTAGQLMDGNTSHNEEEEFIDALGDEMPEVFKNIEGNFDQLDKVDEMLTSIKETHAIDEMTALKAEIDDAASKVEQCEGLVNKLENELIEWDTLKKLCRRDEELAEIDNLLEEFRIDIKRETEAMEMQLSKNEAKLDRATKRKDVEEFQYLVDGIGQFLEDIGKIQDEVTEIQGSKDKCFAEFDKDVPEGVQTERASKLQVNTQAYNSKFLSRKKASTHSAKKPMDMYHMIEINCKYRKRIHSMLQDLRNINQKRRDFEEQYSQLKQDLSQVKEVQLYKAIKGDAIDELFGYHLNLHQLVLPVKRLGVGKYLFGSKQILAKIINGKLVIRVGGGYMSADEFIEQYGKLELMKMMKAQEVIDDEDYSSGLTGEDTHCLADGPHANKVMTPTSGSSGAKTARERSGPSRLSNAGQRQSSTNSGPRTSIRKNMSVTMKGIDPRMSEAEQKQLMKEQLKNMKVYENTSSNNGTTKNRAGSSLAQLEKEAKPAKFGASPRIHNTTTSPKPVLKGLKSARSPLGKSASNKRM